MLERRAAAGMIKIKKFHLTVLTLLLLIFYGFRGMAKKQYIYRVIA